MRAEVSFVILKKVPVLIAMATYLCWGFVLSYPLLDLFANDAILSKLPIV